MSGWSDKRGYALAARIMTSSRQARGEDIGAAGGYSWYFGHGVAMNPARNKWLHPPATAANAPFASGEPGRYEFPVLLHSCSSLVTRVGQKLKAGLQDSRLPCIFPGSNKHSRTS